MVADFGIAVMSRIIVGGLLDARTLYVVRPFGTNQPVF